MSEGGHHMTRALFEENLAAKMEAPRFLTDIPPLLAAGQNWNPEEAAALVLEKLCPLLSGEPWKRT